MTHLDSLLNRIRERAAEAITEAQIARGELTIEVLPASLRTVCFLLRDDPELRFEILLDVCGVDYLHYGVSEWQTQSATATGFERAVNKSGKLRALPWDKPRFAVIYHLLSISNNQRLRVRVFLPEDPLIIDSVVDIWNSANWFERETFDLFGILFKGHPDLRRILTDYGFTGHPFRKDFPLIGNVEVRYDAAERRVIYEPVSIEPRTLVPKVIRQDSRYATKSDEGGDHGRNS